MKIGIYPGTFDPITHGHTDIITRSLRVFDKVVVAVAPNPSKHPLFTLTERLEMIRIVMKEMKQVEVTHFDGLLVDYIQQYGAHAIIRGLRAISDFEHEFQMALMNRKIAKQVETLARERDLSDNRVLVELIEQGIEARQQKEKAFFQLAERFRTADDPEQVKQLGDQLGRFVFGE